LFPGQARPKTVLRGPAVASDPPDLFRDRSRSEFTLRRAAMLVTPSPPPLPLIRRKTSPERVGTLTCRWCFFADPFWI
jgi:hypothetical protein